MKTILNKFLNDLKATDNLTFNDLEGLIDGPNNVDCYIENAQTNLFDKVSKKLGWTFEELQKWYSKNWI